MAAISLFSICAMLGNARKTWASTARSPQAAVNIAFGSGLVSLWMSDQRLLALKRRSPLFFCPHL